MSDNIQILLDVLVNPAVKKQLQAELDSMAKQASQVASRAKKTTTSDDTRDSELKIKLWKAQENAIERVRKAQANQEKAAKQGLDAAKKEASAVEAAQRKRADAIAYVNRELAKQQKQEERNAAQRQKATADRLKQEQAYNKVWQDAFEKREKAEYRIANSQSLAKNQQGSLSNRLEGMVIGKDSLLSKYPELSDTYSKLQKDIETFGQTGSKSYKELSNDIGKFNNAIKTSASHMKTTNKDGYNLIEMAGIAAKKFVIWQVVVGGVMQAFRALQNGVKYVMELDNALNEIRIVTGKSQAEVEALSMSYSQLAKEMSVTTNEITKQAAELYRQGLATSEVEDRMRGIITYAKISGISMADSNKIITATMNATGESTQKVIDIFAQLGDKTASGADEIGEALQKVASTADNAGVSIEAASAMIATISSVTREGAANIGNSLKSIASRYASIKATGFNAEDSTNINEVTKALTAVGIQAVDSNGQLRTLTDVLDELGQKWNTLSKNEQAYIATTMAGTHQRNRLIVLLDNYSNYTKNYAAALTSAGAAQQKFNTYQESTQAHLDKMVASWQQLAQTLIDSDLIKTILDLGTALSSVAKEIAQLSVTVFALVKLFPAINSAIPAATTAIGGMTVATRGLTVALSTSLIGVALVGLVGVLGTVITKFSEAKQAQVEWQNAINNSVVEYKSALETLSDPFLDQETYDAGIERFKQATIKRRNVLMDEEKKTIDQLAALRERRADAGDDQGLLTQTNKQIEELENYLRLINSDYQTLNQNAAKFATYKAPDIFEKSVSELRGITVAHEDQSDAIVDTTAQLDAYNKSIDESNTKIDNYSSNMKELSSLYDSINKGEQISKDTLLDLLSKYPEYSQQIMAAVGEKQSELRLTELLFEAQKQKYVAEQTAIIEELKLKAKLNQLDLDSILLSKEKIRALLSMPGLGAIVEGELQTSMTRLSALGGSVLAEIEARIQSSNIVKGLKIGDFASGTNSKKKDVKTAAELANDAIKAAVDAQNTITEAVKQGVEDRKKAINDEYDAYAEAIDKAIDKNEELWASEDYEKNVAKQMSVIDELTAQKNSYLNAALSGDLTARAKVAELDKKIAEEREKLTETQTERSRDLQTQSLEDMKSAAEKAKDAEIKRLDTIASETQIATNAIQSLFATSLSGMQTMLTKYLSGIGLAKTEIDKILASATSAFGQAGAGIKIAKGAGVSAGEFGAYAEGMSSTGQTVKSAMQVAMEASGRPASEIKTDLANLIAYQSQWTTASKEVQAQLNTKANAIRAKYKIVDPTGSKYPAWGYVGSFASGGINTSTGPAMLHGTSARPEFILNYDQAKSALAGNFANTPLSGLASVTNNTGGSVTIGSLITVQGNVDKAVLPQVQSAANQVAQEFKRLLNKNGQLRFA